MAALEVAIQRHMVFELDDWLAGSSPAMTVGRKFTIVFRAFSASGNSGVIKFGDDGRGDPLGRPAVQPEAFTPTLRILVI